MPIILQEVNVLEAEKAFAIVKDDQRVGLLWTDGDEWQIDDEDSVFIANIPDLKGAIDKIATHWNDPDTKFDMD